ncbi:hypothetical protein COU58_01545 [Candidatus Pacearchaeota archaeon CG10_big_fil_rev_8_21_14_0_10_32_42]|nr:MAG: hypothetical protein COU58_01545 [Candidatus Pacearchaeota archaeon CG10_big_fil_rev_8_21_14_0_10_32_42]
MEKQEVKAKFRFDINLKLLGISFTIFALIISLNPELLKFSILIPLQITLSIPLLLSSIFARSKLAYTKNTKIWENYGYITFLIAYTFLINVLGILLSYSISPTIGLIFLAFSFIMSISYSFFEILENKEKLLSRIKKDLFFGVFLLFGGVLPSINFYA